PDTPATSAHADSAESAKATKPAANSANSTNPDTSPIYGVTIPDGYRKWQFIAPAHETAPLDELRVVLGNPQAIAAIEKNQLPFPDGTVLVKLAWKHVQSPEFAPAYVPGKATTVQVMVKDSKKYAATGGWGFGRFIDGKAVDEAQHQTCFACHQALVKNHDYVFTRLAP
ncbi:MAG TPA: cytochrome P460 family protein, partial [Oxalicibacterium sp.]|nr:cytochrome P460 family protein [Oxalicibacterium sp.]